MAKPANDVKWLISNHNLLSNAINIKILLVDRCIYFKYR